MFYEYLNIIKFINLKNKQNILKYTFRNSQTIQILSKSGEKKSSYASVALADITPVTSRGWLPATKFEAQVPWVVLASCLHLVIHSKNEESTSLSGNVSSNDFVSSHRKDSHRLTSWPTTTSTNCHHRYFPWFVALRTGNYLCLFNYLAPLNVLGQKTELKLSLLQ